LIDERGNIVKSRVIVIAAAVSFAFVAPTYAKKVVAPSALELQQLQTREFEGTKDQVFGSVMSVLQDSGYRIQAADKDTGLVTGISSTKSKMTYNLFIGFGRSKKSPVVTAFIEDTAPGKVRVRLSFVMAKVKSNVYGSGAQDEEPIYDATVYQQAFEQIGQTLFVRKGMNAPAATAASPQSPVAPAPLPPAKP
jgi:tRNA/tmRNA/rRNA uracil-C5-methylase (TrmA/RlmC/RlmD family)